MKQAVIGVVVVAVLVLRLRSRAKRRTAGPTRNRSGLGPVKSDVGLVAAREMRERFRGRIFRVGTLLVLAGVAAAIVIPTLDKGTSQPQTVGVVGSLPAPLRAIVVSAADSAGTTVHFVSVNAGDGLLRSALRAARSGHRRGSRSRREQADRSNRHLDDG